MMRILVARAARAARVAVVAVVGGLVLGGCSKQRDPKTDDSHDAAAGADAAKAQLPSTEKAKDPEVDEALDQAAKQKANAALASAALSASAGGGTMCHPVGTWERVAPGAPQAQNGQPISITFKGDGTIRWTRKGAARAGTWTMAGTSLALRDDGKAQGEGQCKATDEGKYEPQYSPDCATLTLKLVSDPCTFRATALPGPSLARKKE